MTPYRNFCKKIRDHIAFFKIPCRKKKGFFKEKPHFFAFGEKEGGFHFTLLAVIKKKDTNNISTPPPPQSTAPFEHLKRTPVGFWVRRAAPEFLVHKPSLKHTDRTFPVPRTGTFSLFYLKKTLFTSFQSITVQILVTKEENKKFHFKIFLSSLYRNLTQ